MRERGLEPDAMGWTNAIRAAESSADDGDPAQAAKLALGLLDEQLRSNGSNGLSDGFGDGFGGGFGSSSNSNSNSNGNSSGKGSGKGGAAPTRLGWSYAMGAAFRAGDFEAVLRLRDGMAKSGVPMFQHNMPWVAAAEAHARGTRTGPSSS